VSSLIRTYQTGGRSSVELKRVRVRTRFNVCDRVGSDRVEHNVVQTANSQHAVLWPVVVAEDQRGGEEAEQVGGQRGAGHLWKPSHLG